LQIVLPINDLQSRSTETVGSITAKDAKEIAKLRKDIFQNFAFSAENFA